MNNVLYIYWAERKVGRLWLAERGDFLFQYDTHWVSSPEALPISLQLPVREDRIESPSVKAFFSNLLPEGHIRQLIARRLGISEQNDFGLLEALGGECAGALSLYPEDALPDSTGSYEPISGDELDTMIEAMSRNPLLTAGGGAKTLSCRRAT